MNIKRKLIIITVRESDIRKIKGKELVSGREMRRVMYKRLASRAEEESPFSWEREFGYLGSFITAISFSHLIVSFLVTSPSLFWGKHVPERDNRRNYTLLNSVIT
jgi:hypothetical protein